MKFYMKQSVFDAALDRLRFLFDEFENIVVNHSGGKDSTIILHLAGIVAEEKGRLPLKVMFLDQEAEWESVIEHIREVSAMPWVEMRWLQVPFRIFNATSEQDQWLHAWDPEAPEWIRDKEPESIKENTYGTDRFAQLFLGFMEHEFNRQPGCSLAGVRTEESPSRHASLTTQRTYKHITWGNKYNKRYGQYTFYPIYDWTYKDVWKAIHDNGWPYCRLYDYMYAYGLPVNKMRVSSLTHETGMHVLTYLQEVEQETWNKITRRMNGLSSVKHLERDWYIPKKLPWMFKDWREYRDHLLENLITDPETQRKMRRQFDQYERLYLPQVHEQLWKTQVNAIITNDYHGTKLAQFDLRNGRFRRNSKYQTGEVKWT